MEEMTSGVRGNGKVEHDLNEDVGLGHPITRSPRSRSRSPARNSNNNSPRKPIDNSHGVEYRQRSKERTSDKYHKSALYKSENASTHDIPLGNTSYNNPIKLPEHQEEQERRGRSRENDKKVQDTEDDAGGEDMDDMISLMGFDGFGTTKGKSVKGAKGGGVKKEKKSEYRQYMNRQKGFNRPLSPGR